MRFYSLIFTVPLLLAQNGPSVNSVHIEQVGRGNHTRVQQSGTNNRLTVKQTTSRQDSDYQKDILDNPLSEHGKAQQAIESANPETPPANTLDVKQSGKSNSIDYTTKGAKGQMKYKQQGDQNHVKETHIPR